MNDYAVYQENRVIVHRRQAASHKKIVSSAGYRLFDKRQLAGDAVGAVCQPNRRAARYPAVPASADTTVPHARSTNASCAGQPCSVAQLVRS